MASTSISTIPTLAFVIFMLASCIPGVFVELVGPNCLIGRKTEVLGLVCMDGSIGIGIALRSGRE
jgi:hypothetical protein